MAVSNWLQQYLPLAVLKLAEITFDIKTFDVELQQYLPLAVLKLFSRIHTLAASIVATVLTACGIETYMDILLFKMTPYLVATVLTACGIETLRKCSLVVVLQYRLQQYLPLAVLKPASSSIFFGRAAIAALQQYLPLAVLKLSVNKLYLACNPRVATVLTACGIET